MMRDGHPKSNHCEFIISGDALTLYPASCSNLEIIRHGFCHFEMLSVCNLIIWNNKRVPLMVTNASAKFCVRVCFLNAGVGV